MQNFVDEKTSSVATVEGVRKGVVDSSVVGLNGKSAGSEDKKERGMPAKPEVKEEQGKKEGEQTAGEDEGKEKPVDGVDTTKVNAKSSLVCFCLSNNLCIVKLLSKTPSTPWGFAFLDFVKQNFACKGLCDCMILVANACKCNAKINLCCFIH